MVGMAQAGRQRPGTKEVEVRGRDKKKKAASQVLWNVAN